MIKKLLLFAFFTCAISPTFSQGSIANDDFESYNVGNFDGQFNATQWEGWYGGASNSEISTDYAFSGTKSLKIWDHTSGAETDIVALLDSLHSGVHTLTFMQYIPSSGSGAYYNLQHAYTGTSADWAVEIYFGTTSAYVNADNIQTNFTPTTDAWVEQKFILDFPNNLITFYYGGALIHSWALNTIASGGTSIPVINALNLYAHTDAGGTNSLAYYDDMPVYFIAPHNVAVASLNPASPYSKLTLPHTEAFALSAEVNNIGLNAVTNVDVTFEVMDNAGTNIFNETVSVPTLASGNSATFTTTTPLNPTALGIYSANCTVTITETDGDSTNNIIGVANFFEITDSTHAKDDGNIAGYIGVANLSDGEQGHIYDFFTKDSIASVSVTYQLTDPAAIGKNIRAHIYNVANGTPTGSPIASSLPFSLDTSSAAVEAVLSFASPFPVDSGQYFVAIDEGNILLPIAYSNHIFTPNTGFSYNSFLNTWSSFDASFQNFSLMVRPNMTGFVEDNTSTREKPVFDGIFELMPNPTTGRTWVNLELSHPQNIELRVYDTAGKLVQQILDRNVVNGRYAVDLSEVSNGVYFVQLVSAGRIVTRRVLVGR